MPFRNFRDDDCLKAAAQGTLGCIYSTKVLSTPSGPGSVPPGSKKTRIRESVSS